MGPETRTLVLDDNFGFWNWLKYTGHGKMLMKKRLEAEEQCTKQVKAHEGWTAGLPSGLVQEWEELITIWEAAPHPKKSIEGLVNPFSLPNE
ncbi:hypothetical protein BT96DRAFT_793525, partial [Gymnopus androsaceus JB14]